MSRHAQRDRGLQPERTFLSWHRTLVVLVITVLLHLRGVIDGSLPTTAPDVLHRLAPALAVALLAAVLMAHLRRRWRSTDHGLHDDSTGRPPAPLARPWALALLCVATAGLGVAVAVDSFAG